MKTKQINAILVDQPKRRRKIALYICVIFVVSLFALLNFLVFIEKNKTYYVSYHEDSNIDYKVYLKENDFFDNNYLGPNNQYISTLIDYITANFNYQLNVERDDIDYKYKYRIEANVEVIELNDNNLLVGDYDTKKAYEVTINFLKERKDITAIFAISDFMAIGVAKAVIDSGLVVGRDISIIGFDGMDVSCFYNPGITTIKQPKEEMAIKSVEILFDLLKGTGENKHILLDTELIERESCADLYK